MSRQGARIIAALLSAAALSSCSTEPELPDRSTPMVRAEEQRIAALVAETKPFNESGWGCRVRLLRQEASTSWAWTTCDTTSGAGFNAAVRVDGQTVWMSNRDGQGYIDDVRAHFPADLADLATTGDAALVREAGRPAPSS